MYEKFVLIQRFFYHFLSIFDFISCYAIHTTTSIFLQSKIRMQTSEGRKVQNKSWTLGIWIVYGEQGILTQTFLRTCIIIINTAIKIKFQAWFSKWNFENFFSVTLKSVSQAQISILSIFFSQNSEHMCSLTQGCSVNKMFCKISHGL